MFEGRIPHNKVDLPIFIKISRREGRRFYSHCDEGVRERNRSGGVGNGEVNYIRSATARGGGYYCDGTRGSGSNIGRSHNGSKPLVRDKGGGAPVPIPVHY